MVHSKVLLKRLLPLKSFPPPVSVHSDMAKLRYHLTFIDEEKDPLGIPLRFQSCPPSVHRGDWEWPSELQVRFAEIGGFGVREMPRNSVKYGL